MLVNKIKGLFIEEEGQGMTEYGLILGLIAVVAIAALTLLGTQINTVFESIKTKLVGL